MKYNSIYFITLHTLFGQTVGKMLMKVKVFDMSETPIKFRQAVIRELPQIILLIGSFIFMDQLAKVSAEPSPESIDYLKNPVAIVALVWGIADIVYFFAANKHRALHDYIAGTVVMKVEET